LILIIVVIVVAVLFLMERGKHKRLKEEHRRLKNMNAKGSTTK
jgi:preprotein translocase subunit YajC